VLLKPSLERRFTGRELAADIPEEVAGGMDMFSIFRHRADTESRMVAVWRRHVALFQWLYDPYILASKRLSRATQADFPG
jgi:hypothetical protein